MTKKVRRESNSYNVGYDEGRQKSNSMIRGLLNECHVYFKSLHGSRHIVITINIDKYNGFVLAEKIIGKKKLDKLVVVE